MAITWGQYRGIIRRSMLNDVSFSLWTDEQIHDYITWAMDTFAAHTALASEWRLDAESNALLTTPYDLDTATSITLPDDIYEPIDESGEVVAVMDGNVYFLDPVRKTPGLHPYAAKRSQLYYRIWPAGVINLPQPIGADGALIVRYFAYYPHPDILDDAAVIGIPQWAHQPVAFLVGSYAMAALASQSANIDRWKDRNDSGNPEHNALRAQQEYFFNQYERGIARYPTQDRANFFRQYRETEGEQW